MKVAILACLVFAIFFVGKEADSQEGDCSVGWEICVPTYPNYIRDYNGELYCCPHNGKPTIVQKMPWICLCV
ncbi:hypothetical protein RRG08_004736 [Elysia crispata]|uniref:Uncharacterized protein n=1 Tax=Elysia crispata TaxID=231223 RepID=A0AAE1AJT2_9GAST|nr:hypothetical protein RRG08_004736 [Elysia crispata]